MKKWILFILSPLSSLAASCAALCFLDLVFLPVSQYPRFSVFCGVALLLSALTALALVAVTAWKWYVGHGKWLTAVILVMEAVAVFLPGMLLWDHLFRWLQQVF